MKILASLAAMAVSTNIAMAAVSFTDLITPTPWTIGITVAKWLSEPERKVFYVEVTSQGRDIEEAREQGMRMAVEQAVGAVISSGTRAISGRLVLEDIIVYSSGYVDDYKLVDQQILPDRAQVRMQVWVSHSRLANRLLGKSEAAGTIEGGRFATQIQSFRQERGQADRLLKSVLDDYPARSFDIQIGQTRVWVDQYRKLWLEVPFSMTWNTSYLDSLAESIGRINQRDDCGSWFRPCQVVSTVAVGDTVGYFDDTVAYDIMHQQMIISRPQIQLRLLDRDKQPRFRQCYSMAELDHSNWSRWQFVQLGGYRVQIVRGQVTTKIQVEIDRVPVDQLDQVQIDVVRFQDCPS